MDKFKVLICAQGITKDDYMAPDLIDFLGLGDWQLKCTRGEHEVILPSDKHNYDAIYVVNTEKYLAEWSPLGIFDRFGDYFVGCILGKAKLARRAILDVINDIRQQAKEQGKELELHGLGHSFGAQLMAGLIQEFDKLVLCGCPLTAGGLMAMARVISRRELYNWFENFVLKFELASDFWASQAAKSDVFYLWNKKDTFACAPSKLPNTKDIEVGKGHTFWNRKKKAEDCYLTHVNEILEIKR
jgi:hypothetical protein